jgi:hypothetical protein
MATKSTRLVDHLTYRQWQHRNTEYFERLSKKRQLQLRKLGYKNCGWVEIQQTWKLIESIENTPDTHTLLNLRREALIRDESLSTDEYAEGLSSIITDSVTHAQEVLKRSQDRRSKLAKLKTE